MLVALRDLQGNVRDISLVVVMPPLLDSLAVHCSCGGRSARPAQTCALQRSSHLLDWIQHFEVLPCDSQHDDCVEFVSVLGVSMRACSHVFMSQDELCGNFGKFCPFIVHRHDCGVPPTQLVVSSGCELDDAGFALS